MQLNQLEFNGFNTQEKALCFGDLKLRKHQLEFIKFIIREKALCFGDFTLNSGRKSPYFFNSGLLNNGASLAQLGLFYAKAIKAAKLPFDMLFGTAYKGIPIVSATAIALANEYKGHYPYCSNRKEIKDHGEGGKTFGAPLDGRVLIVDDVISAGISANLAIDTIRATGATPVGIVVALDRQERSSGDLSAVQHIEQHHGIQVISIITLNEMVEYLEKMPEMADPLHRIREYRNLYGAKKLPKSQEFTHLPTFGGLSR